MEVGGLLPVELARNRTTILGGAKPLEAIVDQLCIFLMEILMSHDIRRARVHLVAAHLTDRK